MFKAFVLDSGVCRLRIHSIRATCAPRVVRSLATTLDVSGHQHPKSSIGRGRQDEIRIPNPSAFRTNELRKNKLREPTLPNTQSIQREAHLETKDEDDGDTSLLSNAREYPKEVALDNANEDSHVPQCQVVRKVKIADNDESKSKRMPWEDKMGGFSREITVHQDFHAKLHPTVFKNIMRREPLLRGMPVYATTFDAVRSGRNLFIQTERSVRSLQYLLPVMQRILESGPLRHSRPQLLPRPSSLLVLCPTVGHAQEVQMMATRLNKGHKFGVGMMTLSVPPERQTKALRTKGFNVLMSTPENILQWLALPHAKSSLCEALQDLQTLVVDGKASLLRDGDFLQMLKAVMEDIPLQEKTQRVIISGHHDPQLTRLVLQDGYEVHQEPRLEKIQETHRAREKEKKRDEKARKRERSGPKKRGLEGQKKWF